MNSAPLASPCSSLLYSNGLNPIIRRNQADPVFSTVTFILLLRRLLFVYTSAVELFAASPLFRGRRHRISHPIDPGFLQVDIRSKAIDFGTLLDKISHDGYVARYISLSRSVQRSISWPNGGTVIHEQLHRF